MSAKQTGWVELIQNWRYLDISIKVFYHGEKIFEKIYKSGRVQKTADSFPPNVQNQTNYQAHQVTFQLIQNSVEDIYNVYNEHVKGSLDTTTKSGDK